MTHIGIWDPSEKDSEIANRMCTGQRRNEEKVNLRSFWKPWGGGEKRWGKGAGETLKKITGSEKFEPHTAHDMFYDMERHSCWQMTRPTNYKWKILKYMSKKKKKNQVPLDRYKLAAISVSSSDWSYSTEYDDDKSKCCKYPNYPSKCFQGVQLTTVNKMAAAV